MKTISICLRLFVATILLSALHRTATAEEIQLNYRLPQVGQQATHDVQFDLDLSITLRQGGKTISSDNQQLSRSIERHVTVLQTAGDRATKVQVHYDKAQELLTRGEHSGDSRALPIEGKMYVVERRGAELVVTDPDGHAVPDEERGLVTANMDSVGHSNQLGRFLHGKTVRVGETVKLPKEMAADLLGMREANGDAQRVELTLRGIRQEADRRVADFEALVIVKMGTGGMLNVKGDLQLDADSCRITSADFAGPVSSQDQQAAAGDKMEVLTDGTLKATVRSHYLQ